jgi:endoglucanase
MKPLLLTFLCFAAATAFGSDLIEVGPLTDRILLLHFKDGYVIHHKRGEARSHETVVTDPLDTRAATDPSSYRVSSNEDPSYVQFQQPTTVGRKSKGTDFAWFTDRWVDGHAVNDRPDHTDEHWIYLFLPSPMKRGKHYSVDTGALAKNGKRWSFDFNERSNRSEAVHVNLMGYVPSSPSKFAYVYQWAGDKGGLDLSAYAGKKFLLIDKATNLPVFDGRVAFRKSASNPETGHPTDTPNGNFLDADVYECDFSSFKTPGTYVVDVEDIGCSYPFQIDPDVYRLPFRTLVRGLYQSRSGIALGKPYTDFIRPAPHNPNLTPGFKGKLQYSSMRYLDYGSESGTAEQIRPTLKGPLDAWGWYQDAGDWDSYVTHLRVAQELMLAYELNPKAFSDGELNIPESGNGIPDILDEAAWLPRFCYRLRHELLSKHYGTGGLGLRVDGDPFGSDTKPGDVGQGSWEDVNRIWVASGEDPVSTVRYAGAAAQLAYCLELAGKKDPQGVDWLKEARESYAWALTHTLAKDETDVKPHRLYAAAALFRMTGEKKYESQVAADTADYTPYTELWFENIYGPAVYALGGRHDADRDPAVLARVRAAILHTASMSHDSATKRALRWAGNFYFPMLVGQQTTPSAMELAVARALLRNSDPETAKKYTADLYTTCDYFLGTNALNQTWITGVGARHPMNVFHMDSWYVGNGTPRAGIIPYGPWLKEHDQGQGPWDHDWANKTVYPPIDQWPGNERYFDNRCCPLTNEFTIHQNIAPSAAIFGILCASAG